MPASNARLWPVLFSLIVQAVCFTLSITPAVDNAPRFGFMLLGPAVGLVLFFGWLLFASRLPWMERGIYATIAAGLGVLVAPFVHSTVTLGLFIYGTPVITILIPAGLLFTKRQHQAIRIATVTVGLVVGWSLFTLPRIDGFTGQYLPEIAWRWAPIAEQTLLAKATTPTPLSDDPWEPQDAVWPGFRGRDRDSRAEDQAELLDWTKSPPQEVWRILIGPGWSSFAYVSGRLFTQEQRGDQEAVSCYDAEDGDLIWMHTDQTRFFDVVSGPGPRATPTFADGRLFAFGSRALLSCVDAATGDLLWQRDLMEEVNAVLPVWGFASSPLVLDDIVVVYAGGDGENGLVAYHAGTGDPVWQIASRGMNFSSAQAVTLGGESSVLFGDSSGLFAVEPTTGRKRWSYKPNAWAGPAICQPQQINENSLLVPLGDGAGIGRLEVTRDGDAWEIRERWSTKRLRPFFNDFVYQNGSVFGFNQNIFASVDVETGKQNWKRGRYGFGQVVLLTPAGQMIVTTEDGRLVLLDCDSKRLNEKGRITALDGKTWNHPVIARGHLYVRNGEEAVCYALH